MNPLLKSELMSLEVYAQQRDMFKTKVLAHKKPRSISVGPNMTLLFEDRLTIQYQVQEMLRIERIFEAVGIQEELDTYNPLIPDGKNLKATCLIQFEEPEQRQIELQRLHGIEHRIYAQVGALPKAPAIADEDLDRSNDEKTSAVHFLRFEFSGEKIAALRAGEKLIIGVDDDRYRHNAALSTEQLQALLKDFD